MSTTETSSRPLLMIPGPVEISPAVRDALDRPPPSHLDPELIEAFGRSIENMRRVWLADAASQPFLFAGGGTAAMEMTAANLIEAGDEVTVMVSGHFSSRMAEMARRHGARVAEVPCPVGEVPPPDALREALRARPSKIVFATHVDTSTGVRVDPAPVVAVAREYGALTVFDGVCATGGERFEMAALGADVYLTASQKAIGLPPGLALLVASERAMAKRSARRKTDPPLTLDWHAWLPVMQAYEQRRPSYFSTPPTSLVLALDVSLRQLLDEGLEQVFARHERGAQRMRSAWSELELTPVPADERIAAHTLSALYWPEGADASLIGEIRARGVVVAGGLLPEIRERYFRVGHMGYSTTQPAHLERTIEAIAGALEQERLRSRRRG